MAVVQYFGALREHVGTRREMVPVADGLTVGGLVDQLCVLHPALARYRQTFRVAVNEDFATADQIVGDRDLVALIPPVAGGAGPYAVLTDRPLSVDTALASVIGPGQGGVVVFIGMVRDHNEGRDVDRIEYEAYDAMVLRTFADIIARCEAVGDGVRVAIAHRKGLLAVGDLAVVIAASAPHRAEAFEAGRLCIELIKQDVPIWKKEMSSSGAEWIGFRP